MILCIPLHVIYAVHVFVYRLIRLGDRYCEYNSRFWLLLHTKLSNPDFPPELQAQTTLINFTVTQAGLEEQLLGQVVRHERPDLETMKVRQTTPHHQTAHTLTKGKIIHNMHKYTSDF